VSWFRRTPRPPVPRCEKCGLLFTPWTPLAWGMSLPDRRPTMRYDRALNVIVRQCIRCGYSWNEPVVGQHGTHSEARA
jgi:predicted Zn-ribbon and HTH transcriptional regulator